MTCSAGCGERAEHVAVCRRTGALLVVCDSCARALRHAGVEVRRIRPRTITRRGA